MAYMRSAAAYYFSVFALAAFACTARPVQSSPLLPPDPPALGSPDMMLPEPAITTTRLDVTGPIATSEAPIAAQVSPRRMLADFALKLRNIAYVRGGRELTTGFDCSGFVRYVFQQSLGFELASDSLSQFAEGSRVDKDALRMGDLVFFKTHGKRVSHVGIYLDNGLFIHSPSRGKRVRIDHLDRQYWAKRYAGAKRPDALT